MVPNFILFVFVWILGGLVNLALNHQDNFLGREATAKDKLGLMAISWLLSLIIIIEAIACKIRGGKIERED